MQIIELGVNEDGEHVVLLRGTVDEVRAAGALFGEPVQIAAQDTAPALEPADVPKQRPMTRF